MIKYFLIMNKQGATRLARYYEDYPAAQRAALEAELVRRSMGRAPTWCNFIEYGDHKVCFSARKEIVILTEVFLPF